MPSKRELLERISERVDDIWCEMQEQAARGMREDLHVQEALTIAADGGCIDGAHHKQWAINQMVRVLIGDDAYQKWVSAIRAEGYAWDEGIAP